MVGVYRDLWERLGLTHDDFVRTTERRHHRGVVELVQRIEAAGDLYVDEHEGWYCASCELYYTEKELADGNNCPIHGTPAEWKSEENVFFRLSRYQDRLLEWYASDPPPVQPSTRLNEVRSFVESGLRDLSVSRANLLWGIPFPGHPEQTVYVWLDALTNYISALGFGADAGGAEPGDPEGGAEKLARFWVDPAAEQIQLVGKDILRFHAVYWPAFLMSAGVPLPTTVWAHGWWLRDDRKMSKSTGNVVRPDRLIETFGADCLRYFLLRDMVFGQDAQFSDQGCLERFNSDLANGLGNTVSRLVTLSRQAFDGRTPPEPCFDNEIMRLAETVVAEYREAMGELAFQTALRSLWRLLSETSQYMVGHQPWKLIKSEGGTPKVSRILWNCLEAVRIVAVGLLPFLPESAPRVLAAIGVDEVPDSFEALEWGGLPNSKPVGEPPALFPRIDVADYFEESAEAVADAGADEGSAEASGDPMIDIDEFTRTKLAVGTIRQAEAIPKARKLLKLTVDVGGDERTLVAGIAEAYEPEDLEGKQVVVVTNLKPATLMGVESQGMVLAASVDGRPVLLHPDSSVPDGSPVR